MAKLFPIDQDVRVRVEFWNFDAEFYEISWTEISTSRVHIERFQPPWATVQTAERLLLEAEMIIDVRWRDPKPDVSCCHQTSDGSISMLPEEIPFQVTVELATVEPIETQTQAAPTPVPAVARAMAAMVAVAAEEPVVIAKPQPYEQLLAIQREIDLLQRKAQAIRTRDFSKNIDSMRQMMKRYGISRLDRLIYGRHASASSGRTSSRRERPSRIISQSSGMG